jgi:hypothetical protein
VPVGTLNATGVVAAAFTVVFDTNALAVSVASDSFADFATQYAQSGALNPRETSAVVDGQTYSSPFLVSTRSNGVALAGVRRLPASSPSEVLFTLHISLRPGAPSGLYTIELAPTVVRLAAAGYAPSGETLDLLIGHDGLSATYPVALAADGASAHLLPGYVRFNPADPDNDGDGIPDAWEQLHFTDLDTAGVGTDTDGDGLLDILECFMGADPNLAQAQFIIRGERDGTVFRMLFPMRTAHGLDFDTQWSTNLVDWSAEGIAVTPRPDLGGSGDWSIHEASIAHGGAARMFIRLRILD